nr:mechanosensitive ion channel domain-containing protein [Rhizobium setariae]
MIVRCRAAAVCGALAILLALPFVATTAHAQADATKSAVAATVEALQEQVKSELQKAAAALEQLKKKAENVATDDAQLAHLKINSDELSKQITSAMEPLESRYSLVTKRLEEIGAPPADGKAPEDPDLTSDRQRLQGEKTEMNTIRSDAEVLTEEAAKLASQISEQRRKLFAETLLRRTEITPEILEETAKAAHNEGGEFLSKTRSSLEFMWNFKRTGFFAALFFSFVAAAFFMFLVRWAFAPIIRRENGDENPAYITRLSRAFWSTLVPTLAVAAFAVTCMFLLHYFKVLREDIAQIFYAFLWVLAGVYFVFRLSLSIVTPGKPAWRLINVSDRGARRLITFTVLMAVVNGIGYLVGQATAVLDSPIVLSVARGFFSSVVIGMLVFVLAFIHPMKAPDGGPDRPWPRFIRMTLMLMGIGLILMSVIGYIGLAQFAATQIVISGAILITMYIGFLTGHAISRTHVFGKTSIGMYLGERFKLSEIQLDQLGLVLGLAVYVLVAMIGIPSIMLQWGFRGADVWAISIRLFTEIKIGNITISLLGILVGALLFGAGLFVTKWFQRWLDRNVMVRSQVDVGVRNSVNTALGYAGVAIAGLIGISAAGINLSSLALVAGALSLGIGFGLQTIVQNFVSGLILLAERPFKVGDWVVAGPTEGFVRRISVRATEIETFQNQSIIVPNSQLINAAVGNWTLRNSLARSEVAVSVGYDSDPRKVMDILLEIARAQPTILTVPEPNVSFLRFGEFSLDFELRFYLADILSGGPVRNDVRISILERFREEGIEMPFPKRDIDIHVNQQPTGLMATIDGAQPEVDKLARQQIDRRRKAAEARADELDRTDDNYDDDGDNTPDNGSRDDADGEDAR